MKPETPETIVDCSAWVSGGGCSRGLFGGRPSAGVCRNHCKQRMPVPVTIGVNGRPTPEDQTAISAALAVCRSCRSRTPGEVEMAVCAVVGKPCTEVAATKVCPEGLFPAQMPAHLPGFAPVAHTGGIKAWGPRLWARLHNMVGADQAWLDWFTGQIPCGECRATWREIIVACPPRFGDWFAWTVGVHNLVNRKLGKPEIGAGAAWPIRVRMSSNGIGDSISGYYAACGLANATPRPVLYYPRYPEWLAGAVHHPNVMVLPGELGLDFYGPYLDEIYTGQTRAAFYAAKVAATPARPVEPATVLEQTGGNGYVVFSPYSCNGLREWPDFKWKALCEMLNESGYRVVAIGHTAQMGRLWDTVTPTAAVLAGGTPATVQALMRGAACVVSNDSGMVHIAGLLGVPTVCVHAGSLPHEFLFDCAPAVLSVTAGRHLGREDQNARALHAIPVARVFAGVLSQMKRVVGVAITTFGSPAYVALGLAALNRHHPGTPAVVIDDCSGIDFREICGRYGAGLVVQPRRYGHLPGDVAAIRSALGYAAEHGWTNVVKFSRRFIPRTPFLAGIPRAGTAISHCGRFGVARTEAFVLNVALWGEYVGELVPEKIKISDSVAVEKMVNGIAERVGTAPWAWLGKSRVERTPAYLWHDWASTYEYVNYAAEMGVGGDFEGYVAATRNAAAPL